MAAKPKDGGGDFLGLTKSPDRLVSQNLFHRFRLLCQHFRNHRRVDRPRTDRIDPNSSGGIFERSALREPDHAVLGCVVRCSTGDADQTTNRGVVDDRAASLLTHLAQLILHAVPDAAQIDSVYAIEFFAAGISQFHGRRLYAGVVERRIEATEGRYSLRNHRCYLSFVRDIAKDANRFVAGSDEFFCRRPNRILIHIGKRDDRSGLCENSGRYQSHSGTSASNQRNFILKRYVHIEFLFQSVMLFVFTCGIAGH